MTFTPAQCTATYSSEKGEDELSKMLDINGILEKKSGN